MIRIMQRWFHDTAYRRAVSDSLPVVAIIVALVVVLQMSR